MTPTETRNSSGSTDRRREDQDQLLARLRQYNMTERLTDRESETKENETRIKPLKWIHKHSHLVTNQPPCLWMEYLERTLTWGDATSTLKGPVGGRTRNLLAVQ